MASKMDNTDLKILSALEEDSRVTVREVAKRINVPITTVHNRLKKLKSEGIIKRFTIEKDYEKLGKGILAFVFASIDHEKLVDNKHGIDGLKKQLKSFHEVDKIFAVTGDIDLIFLIRVGSIKELDEFLVKKLRNIKGVQKTTTQIVLEED